MKKFISYLLIIILTTIVLKSADCSWTTVDSLFYDPDGDGIPTALLYKSIECADTQNCIALGDMNLSTPWGRVTTDGGDTWFSTLNDSLYHGGGSDCFLSYPDTSFAIVTLYANYYWVSHDKGFTWVKDSIQGFENSKFSYVHFLNKDFGIMLGSLNNIFITKNGAKTWENVYVNFPNDLIGGHLSDFFILDDQTFFFRGFDGISDGKDFIVKTTDQGEKWQFMPPDSGNSGHYYFFSKDIGFSASGISYGKFDQFYKKIIKKTTDGGESWSIKLQDTLVPKNDFLQINFFDENIGVAFTGYGGFYKTIDGGESWAPDQSQEELRSMPFSSFRYCAVNEKLIFTTSADTYIHRFKCGTDGVVDEIPKSETELYPNPAINYFNLKNENNIPPDRVEIYSVLGVLVSEINPASTAELRIGNLPAGMYYLRIYYGSTVESKLLNVGK